MTHLLLEIGASADVNSPNPAGQVPPKIAIAANNTALFDLLWQYGARTSVNQKKHEEVTETNMAMARKLFELTSYGMEELQQAVETGNLSMAKLLLYRGIRPTRPIRQPLVPLAAANNHDEMVNLLLSQNVTADLTLHDVYRAPQRTAEAILRATPTLRFSSSAETTISEYKTKPPVKTSYLMRAIWSGHVDRLSLILDFDGSISDCQFAGCTPYCFSLRYHRLRCTGYAARVIGLGVGINFGNKNCTELGCARITALLKEREGDKWECKHPSGETCDKCWASWLQ